MLALGAISRNKSTDEDFRQDFAAICLPVLAKVPPEFRSGGLWAEVLGGECARVDIGATSTRI